MPPLGGGWTRESGNIGTLLGAPPPEKVRTPRLKAGGIGTGVGKIFLLAGRGPPWKKSRGLGPWHWGARPGVGRPSSLLEGLD